MKAKFLPFLLLTVLLQVSMFSFAHEMISARQIRLKNKLRYNIGLSLLLLMLLLKTHCYLLTFFLLFPL